MTTPWSVRNELKGFLRKRVQPAALQPRAAASDRVERRRIVAGVAADRRVELLLTRKPELPAGLRGAGSSGLLGLFGGGGLAGLRLASRRLGVGHLQLREGVADLG